MEYVLNPIMGGFGMIGGNTPGRRFAGVMAAASGLEYFTKPGYAYDANGRMRPNAYISPNEPDATYLPAFLVPLILAGISATFI